MQAHKRKAQPFSPCVQPVNTTPTHSQQAQPPVPFVWLLCHPVQSNIQHNKSKLLTGEACCCCCQLQASRTTRASLHLDCAPAEDNCQLLLDTRAACLAD